MTSSFDTNISNYTLSELMAISEIDEIQLPGFTFCKGTIPQSKETFLSDIVQPIVYISTAILSTYLLFSVRSK